MLRGQTVGKKSTHVKAMDLSEERIPSLRQAVLRDVGGIMDVIAQTVVVRVD